MTAALFDLPDGATVEPLPTVRESPDKRRTRRQLVLLQQGYHPLGGRLHIDAPPADDRTAPGPRCRTCEHRVEQGGTSGVYQKCDAHQITRGPATDVRAWWPACTSYQEAAS